jgi:hypothetical protein
MDMDMGMATVMGMEVAMGIMKMMKKHNYK